MAHRRFVIALLAVAVAPGSSTFTLSHAGQTYSGSADARGLFQTSPRVIDFGFGSTDTVSINGAFSAKGPPNIFP